jgi:hypothetical protein
MNPWKGVAMQTGFWGYTFLSALKRITPFLCLFLAIGLNAAVFCDSSPAGTIYYYKDKSGVIHFTDTPDSDKFRPFLVFSRGDFSQAEIDRIVSRYSKHYDLDPDLVHAVIKTESDYNPKAISAAGAEGLMQIVPQTQKHLGLEDPFEADSNVEAGVRYLKALICRYKKIPLALAAYNAGPSRVDRYGDIPPYRETRNYVKKVLSIYKMRKGKK